MPLSDAQLVAVIGIIGTITGTVVGAVLEPLRLRFTQAAKLKAAKTALYREFTVIFNDCLQILAECYDPEREEFDRGGVAEVSPGGRLEELLKWDSFKTYDAVKQDPVLLYQLKDAVQIEDIYRALQQYLSCFRRLSKALTTETANYVAYDRENDDMRFFVCGLGATIVQFTVNLPKMDRDLLQEVSGDHSCLFMKGKELEKHPKCVQYLRESRPGSQKCDLLFSHLLEDHVRQKRGLSTRVERLRESAQPCDEIPAQPCE